MIKGLIVGVLFLSGCARHTVITPRGCNTLATWEFPSQGRFFEQKVRDSEIRIEKLLYQNGVICSHIQQLSVVLHKRPSDLLWGLIPGFNQTSVKVFVSP